MNATPTEYERQANAIRDDHRADVENGMSEADASDSDAFERRVLGMDDEDDDWDIELP